MVCNGCASCENFKQDFVARTFALIAPVRPVLYRASCSNKTIPNAPKWYETHQNMSLGSNGVDQVRSSRKTPTRLRGMNFCTSSERFAPSFVRQHNGPICTQTVQNAPKHEFSVQWSGSSGFVAPRWYQTHQNMSLGSNGVDRVLSLRKIPMRLRGTNFCTSLAPFAPSL